MSKHSFLQVVLFFISLLGQAIEIKKMVVPKELWVDCTFNLPILTLKSI